MQPNQQQQSDAIRPTAESVATNPFNCRHTLDWIRMHAWLDVRALPCGDENALGGIEAHITEIMYVLYSNEQRRRATESELPAVLASAANKTTEVCELANLY